MRALFGLVLLTFPVVGATTATPARALDVPFLSGRVVDLAGLLPDADRQRIDDKLAALEQRTSAQIAVLTVPSLEGEPLEDYSMRVASTWKLGQADKDSGVLFLVARDDRKMRIEVGYGLESDLTDLLTGRILDNVVRPKFRAGDYPGGIDAAVDAMIAVVEKSPEAEALTSGGGSGGASLGATPIPARLFIMGMYLLVVGLFSWQALYAPGGAGWFMYLFLMPFHLIFPSLAIPWLGAAILLAWIVGYPIVRSYLKASGKLAKAATRWRSGGGGRGGGWIVGGGGGGWSSGGGGGGFSGGGGSFGGGGSSSSW